MTLAGTMMGMPPIPFDADDAAEDGETVSPPFETKLLRRDRSPMIDAVRSRSLSHLSLSLSLSFSPPAEELICMVGWNAEHVFNVTRSSSKSLHFKMTFSCTFNNVKLTRNSTLTPSLNNTSQHTNAVSNGRELTKRQRTQFMQSGARGKESFSNAVLTLGNFSATRSKRTRTSM